MRALDRKLLRDALHMRAQLAAIAIVVACGIALFVSLRSMHGYLRTTQRHYYDEYGFADVFAGLKQAPLSVVSRIEAIPGVAEVRARVVFDVTLDVPGLAEPATGRLVSVPAAHRPTVNGLHLRRGAWLTPGRPADVLISDAFARANGLLPGDSVNALINGGWQPLRIIGTAVSPEYVYEVRGAGDVFPDNRRFGVIWVEDRALAKAFDMEGAFNDLSLRLEPRAVEADVITRVDAALARYGGLGAFGRADQISHLFLDSEIEETQVTSILLPSIFLGITGFMLHLVLLRLVGTEREQIGTLKAFGLGNVSIATHYTKFALVPVSIGVVLGSGLGYWFAGLLAVVYDRFFQFPAGGCVADPGIAVIASLIGAGAAVLGALGAVRRVVALPPAEAMRPEAPPRFRAGFFERIGLQRWLSPPTRIILRQMERHPVKAALNILGIALAASMIYAVFNMYDAIDVMKELAFQRSLRADVTVAFHRPQAAAVRHELARLPGVLAVEPFRTVPGRLHAAHLAERVAIQGLSPGGDLFRVVGMSRRVYQPSAAGILLTTRLAEQLGVGVGDRVTLEVLEGARPQRTVAVGALADEALGTAAYMEVTGLNRLMREAPTISGAYLAVDPRSMDSLYVTLKRLPAVAGVGIREATLRGFDQTIAESFAISLGVTTLFAIVLAFGMIYNGTRIALSERGRELATLRILGFSRGEVARMLLGEQGILTVLALPVGVGIGVGLAALIAFRIDSELFRMPFVITRSAVFFCIVIVGASAALSALAVRRRITRMDLIAVLKTRE